MKKLASLLAVISLYVPNSAHAADSTGAVNLIMLAWVHSTSVAAGAVTLAPAIAIVGTFTDQGADTAMSRCVNAAQNGNYYMMSMQNNVAVSMQCVQSN
jgi:hypothetical protein